MTARSAASEHTCQLYSPAQSRFPDRVEARLKNAKDRVMKTRAQRRMVS
jgi:hypothetical protein